MHRISVQRLLFAISLTLAVVTLPTIVRAHHAWSDYHWARTANPFTVKMGNNVSIAWQTSLTMPLQNGTHPAWFTTRLLLAARSPVTVARRAAATKFAALPMATPGGLA